MNPIAATMPEWLDALVLAIGWALVLFLVQGLMIGLGVEALLGALRGRSAELRCTVALAGLLLMAACPVATTFRGLVANPKGVALQGPVAPIPSPKMARGGAQGRSAGEYIPAREVVPGPILEDDGIEATRVASAPRMNPRPDWRMRIEVWLPGVVATWLLGVCALALRLVLGLVEVRGLTRRGIESPPGELLAVIDRLLNRLGWRRPVPCFLSRRVEVPSVVGWLRPTILIPVASLARLTAQQLEALLAHELAHIRRLDFLVNAFQAVVETVLFFHPAVWWVSRRIRAEREHCCDDLAVALCGGDRLLVARTLFTLEELRSRPAHRVAATGGSLRERVRRLVLPVSADPRRGDAGWVGAGLMAVVAGVIAVGWYAGISRAQGERATRTSEPRIRGRVLDDKGRPIAGARVRLYRRDSQWVRHHARVEETMAGTDGTFQMATSLMPGPADRTRRYTRFALLADHPDHAVGWRNIPDGSATFEGDIILTEPTERAITVTDDAGNPMEGATVRVYFMGDPSSPSLLIRDPFDLLVEDGPLTAITDAQGHATITQLPIAAKALVQIDASKPGFATTYAFREQDLIRVTPAASLTGTVTGPAGEPLAGIKVVLYTDFMWSFEHATTDDRGRYRFDGLKAQGWDMSAWGPGQTGNGTYKAWIESEQFAAPTQTITLGPSEQQTLDIRAKEAGVIRVSLVEEGTGKPVAGVRIWGFDKETGGSARFNAYTDEQGRATFYSTLAKIHLSVVGPPEGTYIEGDLSNYPDAHKVIDFQGGEKEVSLIMPPIAGPLITISGICTKPDGSPASGATVHAGAGKFVTSSSTNYVQPQRADEEGRFTLEGVPAGQMLGLYAESEDGQLAGAVSVRTPVRSNPDLRVSLPLRPMVSVGRKLEDDRGRALASRGFTVTPKVGEAEFPFLRRTVKSDEQGRIEVDRVVPGLTYHIQEEPPVLQRLEGGGFLRRRPEFDEDLMLAPE